MNHLLILFSFIQLICVLFAFPEQAIYDFDVKNKTCNFFHVSKALFENSRINFKILCNSKKQDSEVKLGILVRESPCFEEYFSLDGQISTLLSFYYLCPNYLYDNSHYKSVHYLKKEVTVRCDTYIEQNILDSKNLTFIYDSKQSIACNSYLDDCEPRPLPQILNIDQSELEKINSIDTRRKRDIAAVLPPPIIGPKNENDIIIPNDGVYLLIIYIQTLSKQETYDVSVKINIKGEHGYLSANDWPFLPFYGIMSLVYLCYAIGWLTVSAMQWKDLLRIQYWIAGVILLGMIEKAVFYLEYSSINSTGFSQVRGAILFAEIVSCFKRALSRMLVLIVSLGYGIVKPRLGPLLQRVVFLGVLYFIFGSIEATIRIYKPKNEPNGSLITTIPLATLDSIITWWIFTSLIQTTHTLKLRRNLVKHRLYRNFTLVLTLAVFASIGFIIWIMQLYKVSTCVIEWRKLWFETAFWHILFSIMLLTIMILFRPTNNNQRYAFTPLLDDESDNDDEEIVLVPESLSQGLKLRTEKRHLLRQNSDTNDNQEILFDRTNDVNKKKKEEELNTIVDTAFPILIDSEDEMVNKKLELSKME